MQQYIAQAKTKGVSVTVLSMIPRNKWQDGKVERVDESYGGWAKQAAEQNGAFFIDLSNTIAAIYEEMGPQKVKVFFPADHTNTNADGAFLNAQTLAEEISKIKACKLHRYLN